MNTEKNKQLNLRTIVILFFLVIYQFQLNSQTAFNPIYLFRNYSVDQGLPSSEIYDIEQDKEGNIWFASDRGVVKYNGDEFVQYHEKDGLISDVVFQIYKDYNDRLWFVSLENQLCYYESGKIKPFKYNKEIVNKIPKTTHPDKNLYISKDNTIIMGFRNNGGYQIKSNGNIKKLKTIENAIIVEKYNQKSIWYSSSNFKITDFAFYYSKEHQLKKLQTYSTCLQIEKSKLLTLTTPTNNLFSFSNCIYDLDKNKKLLDLKDTKIISLNFLKNTILVGGLKNGLLVYRFENGRLIFKEKMFENLSVTDVVEDKSNGFWISTLESGVFYLPNIHFKSISTNEGLISDEIKSIYSFKGTTYLGLVEGSYHKITNDQLYSFTNHQPSFITFSNYNNEVLYSTGVGVYSSKKYILGYWLRDLYSNKGIAYGVRDHIFRFKNGTIDTIGLLVNNKLTAANKEYSYSSVVADDDGVIYAGNKFGISICIGNKIVPFKQKEFKYRVTDLAYSTKWGIVIATRSNGIFQYKNKRFEPIKNLICQDITCLFIDDKENLWAGTTKGLLKLNQQGNRISIGYISKNLGLISNEITCINVTDEKIWVGTRKGLTVIDNQNFRIKNADYKIHLKSIELSKNRNVNIQKSINISHKEDLIKIKFRVVNFITKGKYKYRLHSNSDWTIVDKPEIMLINPDDGSYELEVAFLNENNEWSQVQKILHFEVTPPFWKTVYFKLLMGFLIAFIIYIYIHYKRKQFETKQKLLILEQKALFAQMNPHFIFNTLNSIKSFHLYNEIDKAEYFLGKFSKLLRETLHISRNSSILVSKEIDMLEKYLELEQMRFSDKFEWKIDCNLNHNDAIYRIPNMLIQPFIENSIKHGFIENRKDYIIEINLIYIDDSTIKCQVIDNGIGRKTTIAKENNIQNGFEYISYGEKITIERLNSFNNRKNKKYGHQVIDLEKGTMVEITIPLLKP